LPSRTGFLLSGKQTPSLTGNSSGSTGAQAPVDPYNAILTPVESDGALRSGPLAGKTLLVKDLIDTAGVRTTYGSRIYADHVPERTAPAVRRLLDAGAILVGKASLPEFAWSVTGQNPWYGTVRNPRHPGSTTGGSSSGNAAALAAGLCDLGLGTDTGCSIRLPSACCGTVGLKPKWGAVSTDGVYPLVPTFDTVGPMARTVEEVAVAWSVLTGRAVPAPRLAGRTVGLLTRPPRLADEPPAEENHTAERYVGELDHLGATVVRSKLPEPAADPWPVFYHEAAWSHRATFPSRADEYGDNCRVKLELAQRVDRDELADAYRAVAEWRRYEPDVDLYVSPVLGGELPPEDCDELSVRIPLTVFLRPVNMLGWSALAIGDLQLIAPDDETVLGAGLAWERR
jgi:aspartyl-tRNA(Asn)/glutamyl-tRNA(Gln) amidotransferase subunit A